MVAETLELVVAWAKGVAMGEKWVALRTPWEMA